MSAVSKDYAALAASTSTLLESSMMEGDELYDPTTVPIANEEWSKKGGTSNLCRLCANTSDYFIPIFEGEGLEHELSEKIDKHLPIKVCDSDSLPIHVCYQCASTLIAWHDLLLNCVEAEKKLLQIQQQVEQDDLEESKNIEFDAAPSMDSDNAEDSVEATTPLVTPEEMEKSAPSTSKKNTSIKERPSLKRPLAKKSASSQKKARKTETEISPVGPEDGPAEEETVIGRYGHNAPTPPDKYSTDLEPYEWIKSEEFKLNEPFLDREFQNVVDQFQCDICKVLYDTKESLMFHIQSHEHENGRKPKEGNSYKSGFKHKRLAHTSFNKSKSRMTALRLNSDEQSMKTSCKQLKQDLTCRICDKVFLRLYHLNRHKKSHVDVIKTELTARPSMECLSCELCGRMFSRKYHLKRHKRTHGADSNMFADESLFHCELCGKNFSCKSTLKSHQVVHTGEKPFTCHICGKRFSQTGLYYHLRHVHAGIKDHTCDICGRPFAAKPAMEDHRRIHTGERPYVCATCGKAFKTKATLYIHNKIHTNVFPHTCTHCGKLFRNQHELVKHLVTHTGEKPHTCDVCSRGFRARNEMLRHRGLHSDHKPYVCVFCGFSFKQERYLKRHVKAHHPGP